MTAIVIEPSGSSRGDRCRDCHQYTQRVWGFVNKAERPYAIYQIRWTEGHRERGAALCVSIGGWGGGSVSDRRCVALVWRVFPDQTSGFSVVDAAASPWGHVEEFGAKLSRAAVLNTPLAKEVFDLLDQIIVQDPRFRLFVHPPQ